MDYNNQYNTTYGAQGGGGGGGFMPGSQDTPGGGQKKRDDTLRPVTIKQLNNAEQANPDSDHFVIDGVEIGQVTFIGQIRNISQQTTNITYKIDDGTGTCEVKIWVDSEQMEAGDSNTMHGKLADDMYVRVWGHIKAFNGKKHVGGKMVRPVADFNEINYHLLEATYLHLQATRGPLETKTDTNGAATNGNGPTTNGASRVPANATAGARKVFNCIQQSQQTNEGLHMQDIAMRTGMEVADVLKAGDELQGIGLIYTTVDDHTWAVLE